MEIELQLVAEPTKGGIKYYLEDGGGNLVTLKGTGQMSVSLEPQSVYQTLGYDLQHTYVTELTLVLPLVWKSANS